VEAALTPEEARQIAGREIARRVPARVSRFLRLTYDTTPHNGWLGVVVNGPVGIHLKTRVRLVGEPIVEILPL